MNENFDPFSLNINLIIPFNNNKGSLGRRVFAQSLRKFEEQLKLEASRIIEDIIVVAGRDFPFGMTVRPSGKARKYYWRNKSSKKSRSYTSFEDPMVQEEVGKLPRNCQEQLKQNAEGIMYINANLKVVATMLDVLSEIEIGLQLLEDVCQDFKD